MLLPSALQLINNEISNHILVLISILLSRVLVASIFRVSFYSLAASWSPCMRTTKVNYYQKLAGSPNFEQIRILSYNNTCRQNRHFSRLSPPLFHNPPIVINGCFKTGGHYSSPWALMVGKCLISSIAVVIFNGVREIERRASRYTRSQRYIIWATAPLRFRNFH